MLLFSKACINNWEEFSQESIPASININSLWVCNTKGWIPIFKASVCWFSSVRNRNIFLESTVKFPILIAFILIIFCVKDKFLKSIFTNKKNFYKEAFFNDKLYLIPNCTHRDGIGTAPASL